MVSSLDGSVEQRRRAILLAIIRHERAKCEQHLSIACMRFLDLRQLPVDLTGLVCRSPATTPRIGLPDVLQGAIPVGKIASDDLLNEIAVLPSEPTPRALLREYHLVQQRQTVVPVQNQRLAPEAELLPKRVDLPLQHAVFVVQIRHVGHHEMEIDLLLARAHCFRSDVLHNRSQAAEILIVWKEQNRDRIRKLSGTDAARIRMAGTRVNQHVVRLDELLPLCLEILEQQITIVALIEIEPVNLPEARGVLPVLFSRRHHPQTAAVLANVS